MAVAEHRGNLFGGFRQHHHHRQLTVGGKPVAFEGPHRLLGGDDPLARHDALERRYDVGAARKHGLIRLRHCNRHAGLSRAVIGSTAKHYSAIWRPWPARDGPARYAHAAAPSRELGVDTL